MSPLPPRKRITPQRVLMARLRARRRADGVCINGCRDEEFEGHLRPRFAAIGRGGMCDECAEARRVLRNKRRS